MSEKYYPSACEIRERFRNNLSNIQLDKVFKEINDYIQYEDDEDVEEEIDYFDELSDAAIKKLELLGYKVEKKFHRDPITDLELENDFHYTISWRE